MKINYKNFISMLVLSLLLSANLSFSLDKKRIKDIKSGVLMVATCKLTYDYSLLSVAQFKILTKSKLSTAKIRQSLKKFATLKKLCSKLRSTRKNYVYSFQGHGSGFLINKLGYIITNYHVITTSRNVVVYDGGIKLENVKEAQVIWKTKKYDLAIIKVSNLNPQRKPLTLLKSKMIEAYVDEDVWSLGFPGVSNVAIVNSYSTEVKSDKGVVRAKPEQRELLVPGVPVLTIEHGAFIHGGNSGGPLVDYCGRVLGVNEGAPKGVTGIGWAVHINHLIDALEINNINYKTATSACDYYSGYAKGLNPILLYTFIGLFALIIGVIAWLLKYRNAKPEGMTQYMRAEVSKYFKRSQGNENKPKVKINENIELASTSNSTFALLVGRGKMSGCNFELRGDDSIILGRSSEADIKIDSDTVGRNHVRLSWQAHSSQIWLEDLGSTNGTFLSNGQELKSGVKMTIGLGDSFYLAEVEFSFRLAPKKS